MRKRTLRALAVLLVAAFSASAGSRVADKASRSFRKPAENGWIFVHLEGRPGEIGFQHGSLLAPEIEDA
ncbi:MAG: peptidase C45, partial [Bryobacteraceae bacterium]